MRVAHPLAVLVLLSLPVAAHAFLDDFIALILSIICSLPSFELFCDPDSNEITLQVTSPFPGSLVEDKEVEIKGTISPATEGVVKVLDKEFAISASGDFIADAILQNEGLNLISISVLTPTDEVVASTELSLTYQPPSEGSGTITQDGGGTAEVTEADSVLFGASIAVPPGAAKRDFTAHVVYDPEHVPVLPFVVQAVGPPAVFFPIAEGFNLGVTLTLPFDPASLPAGVTLANVFILAYTDMDWIEVPPTLASDGMLRFNVGALNVGPFIAVIDKPLASGQVLIETSPAFATVYLDGQKLAERTPLVLDGVALGSHEVKFYLEGFNEVFVEFESAENGVKIKTDLGTPEEPVPVIEIDETLSDLSTADAFIEIKAIATLEGSPLGGGRAVISVNGNDSIQNVEADGSIAGFVTLSPGLNQIEVRVNGPDGTTGVSAPVAITRTGSRRRVLTASTKERLLADETQVVIRLSWNTDGTDIDLHVFDPLGNHAYYGNQLGIPGANIDVDDRTGFGPEIFTMPVPVPGTYRVAVDSFRIGSVPTTATLTITVGSLTVYSGSYTFSADDSDDTNGSPVGANPAAFWDAHSFEIGELSIVNVVTEEPSPSLQEAIFTTKDGENTITIMCEAPESVLDAAIRYDIKEVNEDFEIDTSALSGRTVSFNAMHKPLLTLNSIRRRSIPLEYEIVAYTLDDDGNRALVAAPARIKQDRKSQIRQEYVDKLAFFPAFARATPTRDQIIHAGQFVQGDGRFSFNELARLNEHYGPGLAIIQDSVNIANAIRQAWGFPLRATSAWRNPRLNDAVSVAANSFHQTGDAIDLNPSWDDTGAQWPNSVPGCLTPPGRSIESYEDAQDALSCLADQVLDLTVYDTLFHAPPHLHVERDPEGRPDS